MNLFWSVLSASLMLWGCLCSPAAAQETGEPPAAPEAAPAPETAPTQKAIREELDGLPSLEIDEEQKAAIRADLEAALRSLEAAAEFQSAAATADTQLKNLRAQLASAPREEPIPEDVTLQAAERSLLTAQTELEAARAAAAELELESQRRAQRRLEIPGELAAARAERAEVAEELGLPASADLSAEAAEARRRNLQARAWRLEARIERLQAEQSSYEAREALLPVRRDEAAQRQSQLQRRVEAWRERVFELREAAAQDALGEAAELVRQAEGTGVRAVAELAEQTRELARQLPKAVAAQNEAQKRLSQMQQRLRSFRASTANVREKVEAADFSKAIGSLLRKEYENLPDIEELRHEQEKRQKLISDLEFLLSELEDQREAVRDVPSLVEQIVTSVPAEQLPEDVAALEDLVRELLITRKEWLDTVISARRTQFERLLDLDTASGQLIAATEAYQAFIEERILWVRSVVGNRIPRPYAFGTALREMTDPDLLAQAARGALQAVRDHWFPTALGLMAILVMVVVRRRCVREIRLRAEQVMRFRSDAMRYSFEVLGLTLLVAAPGPLALWLAGWLLTFGDHDVPRAMGAGMQYAARFYFVLVTVRHLLRHDGLAEAHFRWPEKSVRPVRRNLRWFIPTAVPLVVLVVSLSRLGQEAWNETVGRTAFVAAMVVLAVFVYRVFRPSGPVLSEYFRRNRGGWVERSRKVWLPTVVLVPIALAAAALWGYYYTALQLERRLNASLLLLMVLILVNGLLLRWLFVARRKLAIERARQQREKEKAEAEAPPPDPAETVEVEEEPTIDIPSIDVQTRRLISVGMAFTVFIGLYAIWVDVLPALRILERVEVWPEARWVEAGQAREAGVQRAAAPPPAAPAAEAPPEEEAAATPNSGLNVFPAAPADGGAAEAAAPEDGPLVVTLADVGLAIIFLLLTYVASRNLPGLMEIAFLNRLPLDAGARFAVTTVARYVIVIVGLTVAFNAISISWSTVQWLAAALTFGLAFGLQEIFANFVSGLIILLERPVRVNDTVTVGGVTGTVSRIRMRATTIVDWDRKELIVPNKSFITDQVINWTLSDPITRVIVPVGIAYGSDTRKAKELLMKVANDVEHVLREPAPRALFLGFGDSSLSMELRYFIPHIDHLLSTKDAVHQAIDDEFRKAGIEIAFPQRDLHVRSAGPLVKLFGSRGEAGAEDGSN